MLENSLGESKSPPPSPASTVTYSELLPPNRDSNRFFRPVSDSKKPSEPQEPPQPQDEIKEGPS